jgi:hypothetical protein
VRAAAAASTRLSAVAEPCVVLDVAGVRVQLPHSDAELLRAETARRAGHSSVARDLALLLGEAIAGRTLALRRGEANTLARVADELGIAGLADRLAAA